LFQWIRNSRTSKRIKDKDTVEVTSMRYNANWRRSFCCNISLHNKHVRVISSFIGKIHVSTVVNHRDRVDLHVRGNGDNKRGRYSIFFVGGETCLGAGTRQRDNCSGNRRTARAKGEPRRKAKSPPRRVVSKSGVGENLGRLVDLSRRQEKIGVDTSVHEAANVLRGDISCTPTGVIHEIQIRRQREAKDQAEVAFLEVTTDQIT
jgi:hypothetical protein